MDGTPPIVDLITDAEFTLEDLREQDDRDLLRLVAGYRQDEIDAGDMDSISAEGMAVQLLKGRGYTIRGDGDDFRVQTPDGETLTASEV